MHVRDSLPAAILAISLVGCQPAGSGGALDLTHVEGLGSLSFPNSGAAVAQAPFLRGVLLLHSFEFDSAAEAFRDAQAADPDFALAHWGEAMTHNHPLWQQQDAETARGVLARLGTTAEARRAKAPTERERLYLEALEALYGDGSKQARDREYMDAMERLQTAFPDDMEARAFHALAILGSRDGARDFATYMRAAATVQPVFDANPDHPGAAHYLIHAFDDPVHAPLGLPAARVYAETAPGASHAQHMTSHIFLAMGMWDDVVAANIRARDTQDGQLAERGERPNLCGHYSSWLQYGHLMRGEITEAESLMDACHARMSENPNPSEQGYFVSMRARQILDTENWDLAARWQTDLPDATRFDYDYTNVFAALRKGDPEPARLLVAGAMIPTGGARGLHVLELRGLVALADGRNDEGLAMLREAADTEDALPFEFGPPRVLKPTHELLGQSLLQHGHAEDAVAVLRRAAERTPGRSPVLKALAGGA